MELGPGEVLIDGEVYYSSAYLDSYGTPDIVLPDGSAMYFKTYRPVASTSVQHARWEEAWATCYCMVLALSQIVCAHAGSAIRQFFTWSGVLFWILMAIFTYGHFA